jgi:hypothetical protein
MRIVLLPVLLGRDQVAPEPAPADLPGQKKRPRVCGLSLAAPGPPGVDEMILNFCQYAKSPAERF